MFQIFQKANYNFIGIRKYAISFSLILILAGVVSLVIKGGPKYDVEFEGGTLIEFRFQKDIEIGSIRSALAEINLAGAEIKKSEGSGPKTGAAEVMIRAQGVSENRDTSTEIQTLFKAKFPDNPFELLQSANVGPKVGKELVLDAIYAVLVSMIGILIYVAFRFEFKFAVGAVIALFHDVMITVGIFSILNMEISMAVVASLLTLVGYSINDTIVVFDRIRENLKTHRKEGWAGIINGSINQTLSRTIITSSTVFIVVLILWLFGGEVLHGFSFALVIGVITGTYSSIYIAAPIVLEWHERDERKKLQVKK